jgi:hypothetical protein
MVIERLLHGEHHRLRRQALLDGEPLEVLRSLPVFSLMLYR